MTMKLLKLHIENFRSLRDVTWEPGDLNVLIGPNAGGKSNLLKAIDLLGAAADGRLRDHVIAREELAQWCGIGVLTPSSLAPLVRRSKDRNVNSRSGQIDLRTRITTGGEIERLQGGAAKRLARYPRATNRLLTYAFNRDEHHGAIGNGRNGNSFGADELKSDESMLLYARSSDDSVGSS